MGKILLLINNHADGKLLREFLSKYHEVILPEKSLPNHFDLLVADYPAFFTYRKEIFELKQKANPVFLPILLLVAPHNKNQLDHNILKEVDEFISMPIDSRELKMRVANLLRTRELSLESETRYYTLAENIPTGICILHNKRIVYCNPALATIFSTSVSDLKGTLFLNYISSQYYPQIETLLGRKQSHENMQGQSDNIELQVNTGEGEKWVEVYLSSILYKGTSSLLIVMTDITGRKQREAEIKHLSFFDKLTGLYNRASLEDDLERLDTKRQLPMSIVMVDVNGLKLVNDAYGHKIGDQLLIRTAEILKETCRKEDLIARWGGDEFIILLPQTSKTDVEKLSNRIKNNCSNYYVKAVPVKIAVGTATKTHIQKPIKQLLIEAEDKMYKSKLMEGNSVRRDIISALLKTLEIKSDETEKHARRLSELGSKFQPALNLSNEDMDRLHLLATMHDIGKITIPEEILKKQGKLSVDEWEEVKKHPETGYRIACSSENLAHIAQEILSHHERWDGKGYPFGRKGKEIPTLARIIAIIDAYDVMTNGRTYKPPISKREALDEIKNNAGTQFDPDLTRIFLDIME